MQPHHLQECKPFHLLECTLNIVNVELVKGLPNTILKYYIFYDGIITIIRIHRTKMYCDFYQ